MIEDEPSLAAARRLEQVCTRFEAAWKAARTEGIPPRIEDYLAGCPAAGRSAWLEELIALDVHYRRKRGDVPAAAEYRERFADLGPELLAQALGTSSLLGSKAPTVLVPGGNYRKLRRLGRGSFGAVWLAEAPGGVRVALKVINRPVDDTEAQKELQALELVRGLRHPFLLQTQAYWVADDQLFIATELADGSLRDRLKLWQDRGRDGIPLDELLVYTRQAAEALDFLHGNHVQHRDVKPENILLVEGYVKLADLGLARHHGSFLASVSVGGTPVYMAPEVWHGKLSPHTDQYSLALTYLEMRLGRRAVLGDDLGALMLAHVGGKPNLDPLPQAEQEVIFRGIAKEPADHYSSCADHTTDLPGKSP